MDNSDTPQASNCGKELTDGAVKANPIQACLDCYLPTTGNTEVALGSCNGLPRSL
jgi:hypothetical protein